MTADRVLRVVATDGRGRPLPAEREFPVATLGPWLERYAPRAARGVVAVALVGDRKMRALNRRFRGVDRATDVLAFPADGSGESPRPRGAPRILGDIVIATGVARRQARAAGQPLEIELRRLALHGLLHLLGYDHTRDGGRMARFERRLQRRGGIA